MSTKGGEAPAGIQIGEARYSRCDEWASVPVPSGAAPPPNARLVFESDGVAVVPRPAAGSPTKDLGPVYRLEPGGPPAVPTGRVFIRLPEGQPANARRRDFEQAGYRVESVPAWAPHTAWLRPESGGIVAALTGIGRLRSLAGVEQVEPQLLRPRGVK